MLDHCHPPPFKQIEMGVPIWGSTLLKTKKKLERNKDSLSFLGEGKRFFEEIGPPAPILEEKEDSSYPLP